MPSCSWRASGLTILRAPRLSSMAALPVASWASSLGRASKHIAPAEEFLQVADVQDIRVAAALSRILGFTKIELLDLDIYFYEIRSLVCSRLELCSQFILF